MGLTIKSLINDYTSYGQLSCKIVRTLAHLGYDVHLRALSISEGFGSKIPGDIKKFVVHKDVGDNCELIVHPPSLDHGSLNKKVRRRILFTLWETTRLPAKFVKNINKFYTHVIVPNEWIATNFKRSGVKKPIHVVPLGIDTKFWRPKTDEFPRKIIFGCAGRMAHGGVRKSLNLVIDTFKEAFPSESDVFLKIKAFPDCKIKPNFDNRIQVIQDYFNPQQLRDWYQSLTAYVTVSTEGWGLHQQEAIACGVPLVGMNYAGLNLFFNGYPVQYGEAKAYDKETYFNTGKWGIVNHWDLIHKLQYIYKNPVEAFIKGMTGRERAAQYSNENFVYQLNKTLKKLKCTG